MRIVWTPTCFLLLAWLSLSFVCRAQSTADPSPSTLQITLMDPTTAYSFRGQDGGGFLTRQPINIPEPAIVGRETGLVAITFTISPQGQIWSVELAEKQPDQATEEMVIMAKAAVKQWQFKPLPPSQPQKETRMRVLVQFNYPGSGKWYSEEGNVIIEGLQGRKPVFLPAPSFDTWRQGVVKAEVTIAPSGEVAWVDRYYGSTGDNGFNPHLGLRTHEALSNWRFDKSATPDDYQQIQVTFHYSQPGAIDPKQARLKSLPKR